MKIENFKTAAKFTVLFGVLIIVFIILFVFSFLEYYHKTIYLSLSGLFFLIYLFLLLIKPHFFGLEEKQGQIIVRFYNPHPFVGNYRQIKLPLKEFDGYEVKKTLFGPRLILKIRRGKQTGQYPPLSITALNKEQKQQLFQYLDKVKSQ